MEEAKRKYVSKRRILIFTLPNPDQVIYIQGEYSVPIVLLSIVIACLASFTSLSLNERIVYNSFFHRYVWLTLASITMGFGIWAMHFIGMSAFMLPVEMKYDLFLTFISVLPAILAAFLAFSISSNTARKGKDVAMAGIIMGIGISSMHYIGMKAMVLEAEYAYHMGYFIVSILIAIVVSFVSLYIFSRLQRFMNNILVKILTALLMGLAISSMHYTGMHAIKYYVRSTDALSLHHNHHMDMSFIIFSVTIGIVILLLLSSLSSLLDRYVDYRLNYYDALTKLPNRRQFEKYLDTSTSFYGVAALHIHDMNRWNNMYGYYFGDQLICYIEDLCTKLKPSTIEMFRIEGNRFVFLSRTKEEMENLLREFQILSTVLSNPITIDDKMVKIHTVVAYSTSEEKEEAKQLYENTLAVLAHYSIRYENELVKYDPEKHRQSYANQLVNDVEEAINENNFYLVYQPKINAETREISGFEALLRWKHPIYGELSPANFIPILEEAEKMFDVTDWIIDRVAKQISAWQMRDRHIPIAINIPGPYVTSPKLMRTLRLCINKYNIPTELIELEMTETSAVDNIEAAIQSVEAFRKYGLSVSLDDFGTGLSSLSYLKRIPVNTLKIDKSFIDGVPNSQKDSEIIRAIIALGVSLHLKIVIEGVEKKEQVEFLSSINQCLVIQGYYFAKPMKIEDAEFWINDYESQFLIEES